MDINIETTLKNRYLFAGISCLVAGSLFYILGRGYVISPDLVLTNTPSFGPSFLSDTFPSFIHTFAFMLISVGVGLNAKKAAFAWLCIGLLFEVSQHIFAHGTFDPADLLAVTVGAACAFLVCRRTSIAAFRKPLLYAVYAFGILSSVASSGGNYTRSVPTPTATSTPTQLPQTRYSMQDPFYITYDQLRASFAVGQPRPINKAGNILLLGSKLLISETNVGVHVFDNTDPSKPVPKYFLNIPGNIDLAAKDGIVYADSFVDLIAISFEQEQPALVHREKDVFPWNPYQAIDDQSIELNPDLLHQKNGVVIGSVFVGSSPSGGGNKIE